MYVQDRAIEFLNAEEVQPIDIHKRLVNTHGGKTVDVSTIRRWVCFFQSRDRDVIDKPCSGRPITATNKEKKARLDKLINSNQQVNEIPTNKCRKQVNEMSTEFGASVGAVEKLISSLGYSKRYVRWVLRMLILEQKDHWVTVSQELLKRYKAEDDAFLDRIVTDNKTWCHYYEPESKRQSIKWLYSNSPPTKVRSQRSASKVVCTAFWGTQHYPLGFLESRSNCRL